MNKVLTALAMMAGISVAQAATPALTVYQDPSCGCCSGWVDYMRQSGFEVRAIQTQDMGAVKDKLGVPAALDSCHTAVVAGTGQIIEGHVPVRAVQKMLADASVKGVAAPGMPLNAPGMGALDGNLVTVDFDGQPFSKD